MIFLDANLFLRFLVPPESPELQRFAVQARSLWRGIRERTVRATTSEVVLHEVCYVLHSPRQYGYDVPKIVKAVTSLVMLPGLDFPSGDRDIYLRALDLWSQHPKLGFADSVIAARCERAGHELATFDRHFQDLSFLQLWQPASSGTDGT
ncbi:MAG: type II toxin-antitoxin system VapC family toxin [Chloroflexia bacterium]|nr:type II toxin-antitoxin system VapC family toxin [Chloroflexia bacterium]